LPFSNINGIIDSDKMRIPHVTHDAACPPAQCLFVHTLRTKSDKSGTKTDKSGTKVEQNRTKVEQKRTDLDKSGTPESVRPSLFAEHIFPP
jgi:hypothetical protein